MKDFKLDHHVVIYSTISVYTCTKCLHWTVSWCLEVCFCFCVIQATRLYYRQFPATATASSSAAHTASS